VLIGFQHLNLAAIRNRRGVYYPPLRRDRAHRARAAFCAALRR
jgi:hypothetical protein